MTEGKTNMFGKTYNTIGSTDSNFIIKTKGDLKVLWGNKYIDVIKNGKIASEGSKVLFIVNSPEEIKLNGIYIVTSVEGNELWVCIDGIKIQIVNTSEDTTYVSFLTELKTTSDLKHQALTNIGFYYETLADAKDADIVSGIVYVERDNKLYIANNGILKEYLVASLSTTIDEDITEKTEKHPLYILDFSLWVENIEYVRCLGNVVQILKQLSLHLGLLSVEASADKGYRLYIDDLDSILEIDRIIWRKYPNPITYTLLEKMIETKSLSPKMYYLITDFLNPWEVTWSDESIYYEDLYLEINKVKHLCGLRNATLLIILASSWNTIEKLVWSPMNPEWIIYYDHTFKGPEHKISEEEIYHGYRTRTKDDGTVLYLPCKGVITYLKDELGNEGDFNFRQFRFKTKDSKWRYIMDSETEEVLGTFIKGTNNVFNLKTVDSYILLFDFKEVRDNNGNITSFTMSTIDSEILLGKGHNIVITTKAESNIFEMPEIVTTIYHNIYGSIINNKFLLIHNIITILNGAIVKNNLFEELKEELNIKISCDKNVLKVFLEDVIIEGTSFNNNYLTNFLRSFLNLGSFNDNIVNECSYTILNKDLFVGNYFNIVNNSVSNYGTFEDNIIELITSEINNNDLFKSNSIELISGNISNRKTFTNNTIKIINSLLVNNFIFNNNTIGSINGLIINADIENNNIKDINICEVNGIMNENSFCKIDNCVFNDIVTNNTLYEDIYECELKIFTNNIAYKEIVKLISTENIDCCVFNQSIRNLEAVNLNYCNFKFINTLILDKPVYHTTFHGYIGNITRLLTDYEWELLLDVSRKKDVYPNIRVVCVPEIILAGMILMWYSANPIPKGWAICDGSNNTPDLRNRFIRGINTDGSGNITEKSEELNPSDITLEIDSTSGKSISKLELKKENIPNHEHPHYHTISSTSNTVEIDDDYAYGIYSGTAASGDDIDVEKVPASSETESITIEIPDTDLPTYTEGELKDTPDKITIEPKSYIMIFIMKIDENPIV